MHLKNTYRYGTYGMYGMYEELVNLYKMKSIVMFRNFIAKEGGNVMIHKPHLTFHRNTEWMKMAATPHY